MCILFLSSVRFARTDLIHSQFQKSVLQTCTDLNSLQGAFILCLIGISQKSCELGQELLIHFTDEKTGARVGLDSFF